MYMGKHVLPNNGYHHPSQLMENDYIRDKYNSN